KGFVNQRNEKFNISNLILATGHSARDIYELLEKKKVLIEPKPFALGIRVEHPQSLIDSIQYHSNKKNPFLPAATYSLVSQINGRGVFSFCMCPGGVIVPAGSQSNEIVVNGMSNSNRNSPFANAGIVVTLNVEDYKKYYSKGPLSGLMLQSEIEHAAFDMSENALLAPAQKLTDFVNGKFSNSLNSSSYLPGLKSFSMDKILPKEINECLRKGFLEFDKKMKGFYTEQANVIGFESRTSSPIKIVRNPETYEHIQVKGLYPCGEGAGYAGGIISSAIDGVNTAKALSNKILK
ncbi:MAG: FAD-binding protein, partial [Bacteroidetes bacterium]|nr:FAD-binding protein [Bacteroidota bacterium]